MVQVSLVTGAGGFIGKEYLKQHPESIPHTRQVCDITQIHKHPELFKGVSSVIHLASTVDNYHIINDYDTTDIITNCVGTQSVLEGIRKHAPQAKMVYVSTFFVNDGMPKALYGATKLCAEHIVQAYYRVHQINYAIVRPSNVYGAGDYYNNNKKSAFARMIKRAVEGNEVELYEECMSVVRDYVHVSDVVKALNLLTHKGVPDVYEVGTGKSQTLHKLVRKAFKLADQPERIKWVKPPKFHEQVAIRNWMTNTSKIRALGWEPQKTYEQGIGEMINEIRTNNQ